MGYRPGLFKRVCDRTGFTVLSSETVKQWNGLVVRKASSEPRHPQEFVRGRSDKQTVPNPRPRQIEEFVGPLTTITTVAAVAGASILQVESTVRFLLGDRIGVMLDTGVLFRVVVTSVPSTTQLNVLTALPYAVAAGNLIINYSAVSVVSVE